MIVQADSGIARSEALRSKALAALANLPPFSPILTRVLATLTGEDVVFSKLGDLIEKDTVLAGNLLNIVNSALYARRNTIVSVRHAISLLGLDKLRNAVLAMSISRMWNKRPVSPAWSITRFNMHSAASGILSDLLAQRLSVSYAEGAFVAGLLHDMGQMLIVLSLPAEHAQIVKLAQTGRTGVDCEHEVLGFTHPELSAEALTYWRLPPPVAMAVRHHHAPDADDSSLRSGEIPLSRIIEAANNYVNSTGVSIIEPATDSTDATLIEKLLPDVNARTKLLEEFKAEYDVMLQFFR